MAEINEDIHWQLTSLTLKCDDEERSETVSDIKRCGRAADAQRVHGDILININILQSKRVWEGAYLTFATGHTYLTNCYYFKYCCGVINHFVYVQIFNATSQLTCMHINCISKIIRNRK